MYLITHHFHLCTNIFLIYEICKSILIEFGINIFFLRCRRRNSVSLKSRNDNNSAELIDNSWQMIDNYFEIIDNCRQMIDNSLQLIDKFPAVFVEQFFGGEFLNKTASA